MKVYDAGERDMMRTTWADSDCDSKFLSLLSRILDLWLSVLTNKALTELLLPRALQWC